MIGDYHINYAFDQFAAHRNFDFSENSEDSMDEERQQVKRTTEGDSPVCYMCFDEEDTEEEQEDDDDEREEFVESSRCKVKLGEESRSPTSRLRDGKDTQVSSTSSSLSESTMILLRLLNLHDCRMSTKSSLSSTSRSPFRKFP